ncbi:MAG: penicillin-binding transpeptidase domain-containing protein [Propionibacteriaceae bacterium]
MSTSRPVRERVRHRPRRRLPFAGVARSAGTWRPCRWGSIALVWVLVAGCSGTDINLPGTSRSQRAGAGQAATELAAALSDGDLTKLAVAGTTADEANRQFRRETADVGADLTATVQNVDVNGSSAAANLRLSWAFPGVATPWVYVSTAVFTSAGDAWQTNWAPTITHPDLNGDTRLVGTRIQGVRGDIRGAGNRTLMTRRPVVRIGIDKTLVDAADQPAAAASLAKLVDIDAKTYAAAVEAAGTRAFVEAIVLRADADNRPTPTELGRIKGTRTLESTAVLAPTRDFARPLLGTVGSASKELVDDSSGAIVGGDQVGLSGLQRRYDEQLRGTPGVSVAIVGGSATPSPGSGGPSESTEPSRPASPPSSSSPTASAPLFEVAPTNGAALALTLDQGLQTAAEKILTDVVPASAIVAIRPSSGEVLVAASGPGSKEQSTATVGQYAPGSTFKVISSLALLRAGLTPSSKVTCPAGLTVDGKAFKNYSDYPSDELGTITLRTALAQSCNTAFISSRDKLGGNDLTTAAASLGVGSDYDVGFPSYFGSVPAAATETGRAADMIGQGTVQASPLAMAAVAASVSGGRTVIPRLIADQTATSTAKPLTTGEADQLRSMMGSVVSEGPGRFLQSVEPPAVIAKTGTAEYGTKEPYPTHAWMIGAQGDLAVAVFVADGDSGSTTAGPLLKAFLTAAR